MSRKPDGVGRERDAERYENKGGKEGKGGARSRKGGQVGVRDGDRSSRLCLKENTAQTSGPCSTCGMTQAIRQGGRCRGGQSEVERAEGMGVDGAKVGFCQHRGGEW